MDVTSTRVGVRRWTLSTTTPAANGTLPEQGRRKHTRTHRRTYAHTQTHINTRRRTQTHALTLLSTSPCAEGAPSARETDGHHPPKRWRATLNAANYHRRPPDVRETVLVSLTALSEEQHTISATTSNPNARETAVRAQHERWGCRAPPKSPMGGARITEPLRPIGGGRWQRALERGWRLPIQSLRQTTSNELVVAGVLSPQPTLDLGSGLWHS